MGEMKNPQVTSAQTSLASFKSTMFNDHNKIRFQYYIGSLSKQLYIPYFCTDNTWSCICYDRNTWLIQNLLSGMQEKLVCISWNP
jgi:hypothetical protein